MNELLIAPEGMRNLNDESTEGMIAKFQDYGCRDVDDGEIIFNRVQQKGMISLKDWVKEKVRLQEEAEFETGTTRAESIKATEEAPERKEFRINQKNIGESLITTELQVQLETATQWDRWEIELESNLKMIIGAKGIALYYVIREDDVTNLEDEETWEYKAMLAASHKGNTYLQENLTVHDIILRKIADVSDAFTYVKPYLKKDNGILDIQALMGRYENEAIHEQYINRSKRTLEKLTSRN